MRTRHKGAVSFSATVVMLRPIDARVQQQGRIKGI
jgi:hypothetical protein